MAGYKGMFDITFSYGRCPLGILNPLRPSIQSRLSGLAGDFEEGVPYLLPDATGD